MADLMRLLESHSRSIKQNEDKISAITQQEDLLRKEALDAPSSQPELNSRQQQQQQQQQQQHSSRELEDARATNAQQRQSFAEAQAKHGELSAELQQKEASMATCQVANTSTKQTIASMQQQRQALRKALQDMQQAFITDCAALHSHAAALLAELRCSNLAGLAGALPEEFCFTDHPGDAAAYVTAGAAGKGLAGGLAGKQQQLMFEPQQAEEEWSGMGDAAALLYCGGLLQCSGGGCPPEQQLQQQ